MDDNIQLHCPQTLYGCILLLLEKLGIPLKEEKLLGRCCGHEVSSLTIIDRICRMLDMIYMAELSFGSIVDASNELGTNTGLMAEPHVQAINKLEEKYSCSGDFCCPKLLWDT